ncbi:MAG: polysaccharide biosynthesis/export family protein [Bacteroidetes bacterium]|nr:polysaccharide biosynthesis/export family protein [Bacteroidota bacterium]
MGTRITLFASLVCFILLSSCNPTNKIAYFQNAKDTAFRKTLGIVEAPLQAHDFISISISSASAEASAQFNPIMNAAGDKTAPGNGKTAQYVGYLIDNEGKIELPVLGKITAAGLTKTELKAFITKTLLDRQLLVEPLVDIRYLNFEVTVLGEVGGPSVISVPSEKISLIKALGLAGDLTIYGRRDNILLIREEDGIRKTRRINLLSADFLNSDYYYLKPNDVVYVEPNKSKVAMTGRSQQVLPLVVTGLSFFFLIFDKIVK